jgi:hypothetical protein
MEEPHCLKCLLNNDFSIDPGCVATSKTRWGYLVKLKISLFIRESDGHARAVRSGRVCDTLRGLFGWASSGSFELSETRLLWRDTYPRPLFCNIEETAE